MRTFSGDLVWNWYAKTAFYFMYVYSNIPLKYPKAQLGPLWMTFLSQKIKECFIVPRNACVVFIIDFCTKQWSDFILIGYQLDYVYKNMKGEKYLKGGSYFLKVKFCLNGNDSPFYIKYSCHYNKLFIFVQPTFWRPFHCFQGFFLNSVCLYCFNIVCKSGLVILVCNQERVIKMGLW